MAEGEVYTKGKKGWNWKIVKQETIIKKQDTNNNQNTINDNQEIINNEQQPMIINEQENMDDNTENIPEEDIVAQPKIERENKLAVNQKNIFKINLSNDTPRVLGAETIREDNTGYFFTPENSQQEHYAIVFIKNIFTFINLKINTLINYFFS